MRSFFLLTKLASELAARTLTGESASPSDFPPVDMADIDPIYSRVKLTKFEEEEGRHLLSCSSWSNISLDLSSFANGSKNYYAAKVTNFFTAIDNTSG